MDLKKLIALAGLGAGLMYFFDPREGRRRRALLRDKIIHGKNVTSGGMEVTSRDLRNKSLGFIEQLRALISKEEAEGQVLAERVRAYLGGVVSHPDSIHVEAEVGKVILSGDILAEEAGNLLMCVRSVRGVKEVEDRLSKHDEPGNVPGLQGESERRTGSGRFERMQSNWSPTARFLTGVAGGTIALFGLRSRGLSRMTALTSGFTLLARAVSNTELRRLFGVGPSARRVDVQETVQVDGTVESAYETGEEAREPPARH